MRVALVTTFLAAALLPLAGCGRHPLAGGWAEHVADGHGRELQFDPDSNKLLVHWHGRADGGEEHLNGEYALDGQKLTLWWQDGAKRTSWTGTLAGDRIDLVDDAGTRLVLKHGDADHDHDH